MSVLDGRFKSNENQRRFFSKRKLDLAFTFFSLSSGERERESFRSLFLPLLFSPSLSLSLSLSPFHTSPPPPFLPTDVMFRGTFQAGYLTVFNAVGSKPLQLWETDGKVEKLFFSNSYF